MKETNTRIRIILILIFICMATGLFFLFNSRKNENNQQHLKLITERYQFAYNTVYDQYKQLAITLQSGIIKRYNIPELYQELLTADEDQKNYLRQELLTKIQPRYKEIQQAGKVRQLHFHLQNNESFLRLHRPGKFGDNLTNIRATVNHVNTVHTAIDGFEEGRIFNGYRFVFPITAPDQTHLGSMEISFGPDALTSSMMQQYNVLSNFLIKKQIVEGKVFHEEFSRHYKKSVHDNYLYDLQVLAALKRVSHQKIERIAPQKNTTSTLLANATSGQTRSFYAPALNKVITTIPVVNPVTREMVAFFTIRSPDTFHQKELHYFRIIFPLSLVLLSLILFTFYLLYSKKRMLELHHEQLESQTRRLAEAQSIANLGHWELDIITDELKWSDQLYRIFGMQPQEVTATLEIFKERTHPDDRDLVTKQHITAVKTHKPYDIQHRIITVDGEVKWIRQLCSIMYDEQGNPRRALGTIHDVTSQKKQEEVQRQVHRQQEELKRFESLKTMAGAIAHRFNNTMMAVNGNLDLLTLSLPTESSEHKMATDALTAAKLASQVSILMLSYVGQRSSNFKDVALEEVARESHYGVTHLLHSKISVTFIKPDQPLYCSIDQQQIKEVIENILVNAIESLNEEEGSIEITFGSASFKTGSFPVPFQNDQLKDGTYVFCQIKDSGHGIDSQVISQIFEPFYSTKFVGRGLGLAMTVGIMQSHKGAITVESRRDHGTCVRILLPPITYTPKTQAVLVEKTQAMTEQFSGNILIADDEPIVLALGEKILETLGFTVYTAVNGQEALDLIRNQHIDFCAVLLDVSMPKMDGIKAMHAMRKINPTLPIILNSGYSMEDLSFTDGGGREPEAFLSKPYRLSELRACLEKVLA